ncbi:hypothetical protein EI94DRAFT_1924035 [Lactarius quietus]|nr:hypothetical protein EI94DRAFT_1924035 [Lactarius quietus]
MSCRLICALPSPASRGFAGLRQIMSSSSKCSLSRTVWPWPMGVLTFDWGQNTAVACSPLSIPWWAAANNGISVVFFSWFLFPILYYTNTWYGAFLPIVSSQSFDNTRS